MEASTMTSIIALCYVGALPLSHTLVCHCNTAAETEAGNSHLRKWMRLLNNETDCKKADVLLGSWMEEIQNFTYGIDLGNVQISNSGVSEPCGNAITIRAIIDFYRFQFRCGKDNQCRHVPFSNNSFYQAVYQKYGPEKTEHCGIRIETLGEHINSGIDSVIQAPEPNSTILLSCNYGFPPSAKEAKVFNKYRCKKGAKEIEDNIKPTTKRGCTTNLCNTLQNCFSKRERSHPPFHISEMRKDVRRATETVTPLWMDDKNLNSTRNGNQTETKGTMRVCDLHS